MKKCRNKYVHHLYCLYMCTGFGYKLSAFEAAEVLVTREKVDGCGMKTLPFCFL